MRKNVFAAMAFGMILMIGTAIGMTGGEASSQGSPVQKKEHLAISPARIASLRQAELARNYRNYFANYGLQVKVSSDAKGAERVLQESVARRLEAQNWVPEPRLAYFNWLSEKSGLRCNGWHGRIVNTARTHQGISVTLSVVPLLSLPRGVAVDTTDVLLETYELTPKGVRFLEAVGSPAPKIMTFQ